MNSRSNAIFVTGTDTGVGKTIVSAGLVRLARRRGLRAIAIKPVETGCTIRSGILWPEDGVYLRKASENKVNLEECVPFRFSLPASPYRASIMDGKDLSISEIERHVRAFHPWPGTFTHWQDKILKILSVSIAADWSDPLPPGQVFKYKKEIAVATSQGAIILQQIQPAGKRAMLARDFVGGAANFVGSQL